MVSFETNPYPHNTIKTICRESKCKSRAELAKLAWAIMPKYRANECRAKLDWDMPSAADIQRS